MGILRLGLGSRVYVAGPFSEYVDGAGHVWTEEENVRRALLAVRKLRGWGLIPFVPHVAVPDPGWELGPDLRWRVAMRECLVHLAASHATVMLDDWAVSRGARMERWKTLRAGRPCFDSLDDLRAAMVQGV